MGNPVKHTGTGRNLIGRLFAGLVGPLLALTAASCTAPDPEAPVAIPADGARLEATVYLSARGPDRDDAQFHFPWRGAAQTVVTLGSVEDRPMPARISCTGAGQLIGTGAVGADGSLRPGKAQSFILPARGGPRLPALVLPPETKSCTLDWGDGKHLALVREDIGDPEVARLDARTDTCVLPPDAGLDPLERVFFGARILSETCPRPTGRVSLYPDETEALRVRLEMLTGGPVSREAIMARDPDMKLDFSHAPRFDLIILSYLNIRADLSGYLVARALAFHAARGTKVRIAVANSLMLAFDRRLYEALAAQYPNVQIQYFRWAEPGVATPAGILDSYQRTNHVKIFLGLSPQPGRSFAIVGGRNLWDGFFFRNPTELPDHPFLQSYTTDQGLFAGRDFFSAYEDFEIAMFDKAVVTDIASHFGKFWNRDGRGQVMAPAVQAGTARGPVARDGLVRHFISVPWADARDHEQFYVDLFDAAEREIIAVTPFTYPTPAIDAALRRAHERGVRVRIVTRAISEEPPGVFTTMLNHAYLELRGPAFGMRTYTPDGRLLHTKIILIDGRLGLVASSNLNARSYIHDTENGLVFLDRSVVARLSAVVDRYIADSRPPPEDAPLLDLGRAMLQSSWLAQFF